MDNLSLDWNQSSLTSQPATIKSTTCHFYSSVWSLVIAAVLEAISIYILTALAIFFWKSRNRKNISKLNHLCLVEALFTCLCCTTILLKVLPTYPYKIMLWVGGSFYWVGLSLTYTILWVRQRRFYSDELLADKSGKCHRVVSSVVIVGIYICLSALMCAFQSKVGDCSSLGDINDILPILITFIIAIFAFQILLFYLLVHPLRSEDGVKVSDILFFRLKKDIHKMVVRLAICTSICIFTNILMCIVIILISKRILQTSWLNAVALDLIVNTIAVVCTFKRWKTRLFPFCESAKTDFSENYTTAY
ncbi:uncharacterized protein LOC143462244 [Clavelina lepadiformis]|uniref:uncharacterized protein LOC143462244 n=1 Tax=Clavelina lepadiformis TaxID=159417 RepID=UPI00404354EA